MSTPNSSDSGLPNAILVAKRARKKPSAKFCSPAIPWAKIAIGGTIAFQVVVTFMALYFFAHREEVRVDQDDLPPLPRVAVKDPLVQPEAVLKVKDVEPMDVVRVDELDDLPDFKNEFVECARIGTEVRFMKEPAEAFKRARAEKKMVFMVHLAGNLEDPQFT